MLQEFFNLLDLPGSSVRDLAGGENPLDQWASPENWVSGNHRLSGAQLVSRYTGASPDSWGSTIAGFGAEMFLDPTNLMGGLGILKKALATRKLNALGKVTSVVDDVPAGRYGYANPKAVEAELITDPIRSSPLREDFGQRRIPQMESDYFRVKHGSGRNVMAPETVVKESGEVVEYPHGRFRLDKMGTNEGSAYYGPGGYVAENEGVSDVYFDNFTRTQRRHPEMPRVLQKWAERKLRRVDPDDPRSILMDSQYAAINKGPDDILKDAMELNTPIEAPPSMFDTPGRGVDYWKAKRDEMVQDLAEELEMPGVSDPYTLTRALAEKRNRSAYGSDDYYVAQDLSAMLQDAEHQLWKAENPDKAQAMKDLLAIKKGPELRQRYDAAKGELLERLGLSPNYSMVEIRDKVLAHNLDTDYADPRLNELMYEVDDITDMAGNLVPSDVKPSLPSPLQSYFEKHENAMPSVKQTGAIYEFDIPKKHQDKFMLGDEPVDYAVDHIPGAKDFPTAVQDVLGTMDPVERARAGIPDGLTTAEMEGNVAVRKQIWEIAKNLGYDDPTKQDLAGILKNTFGISGNKFLDKFSRLGIADKPTYNYAIWDQDVLDDMKVRKVYLGGRGGTVIEEPINRMLQGGRSRATVVEPDLVNTLGPTTRSSWSPGTERLLNRKAAAALAVYNMAARQGGYTVE